MPLFNGRATVRRFQADGAAPSLFDSDFLEQLASKSAGRSRVASSDGVDVGWTAGRSVLDLDFELTKNVYPGFLAFEFRVDTDKLPPDLLKAYYEAELKALSANNPSGFPSARQKREAKESARDRLEAEAKDGRFRKRKTIPVLWHGAANQVYFGSTALTHVDRFLLLFQQTFGRQLTPITAGSIAMADHPHSSPVPAAFVPGVTGSDVAWIPDSDCLDWLGNEFAVWLWWHLETEGYAIELGRKDDVTAMLARRLMVDCPRGMTGRDGFLHEGPTRLPEAKRALQAGKLPRRFGLTLVRHDEQFEFTLDAESLAVSSGRLPAAPEDLTAVREQIEHRFRATSDLFGAVDGLYRHFLELRLGPRWASIYGRIQGWIAIQERRAA